MKRDKAIPPKLAQRLLLRFLRSDLAEEVQGDLEENFYLLIKKKSLLRAKLNYWYQALNYVRPFAIRKSKRLQQFKPFFMYRHTITLAFRNYMRYKSSFFINLTGLSTGLACAMLIYLWVTDELSYDKFHTSGDRLYQVMANHNKPEGISTVNDTPGLLADALRDEVAGVEDAACTSGGSAQRFSLKAGDNRLKSYGQFGSEDFFKLFSYQVLQGSPKLNDKDAIVISESLAKRLFGTAENVLGKSIDWEIMGLKHQCFVSAVYKDVPVNSSIQFDFVLSFKYFKENLVQYSGWSNNYATTYVRLKEGANVDAFNAQIVNFMKTKQKDTNITLFLQQYSDRYLFGTYENGMASGGRISYVKLFSVIAIFILLIACINFMNLSTARASRRLKEVGIKKAIGANRKSLISQYLGESIIISILSLFVAAALVAILLPQFNLITGKHLLLTFDRNIILSALALALVTGILAGSYPALYLSGFNPAEVLKGKLNTAIGELFARKGLVVFQFSLSIILIVAVFIVYQQIEFVQNKNLGYTKDHIIYIEKEGKVAENIETFINEVKKLPGITEAAPTTFRVAGDGYTYGITWEGNEEYNIQFHEIEAGYDATELLGFQLASGRSFSNKFPSDSSAILFNEKAIQMMGLKDPIGKKVKHYSGERTIVGILKDFQFESLYEPIKPVCVLFNPQQSLFVMIKLQAAKEQESIASLQNFYASFNPGFSFDYKFMDEDYQNLYSAEQRVSVLSRYFAGLAIVISCLGLFALAAFTTERRLKEIGIRKVLGSSEWRIIYLLSSDFTKMVVVAILLALPVSYFLSSYWLENFSEHIELKWYYFIGAGFIALLIAWLTVGLQTFKAAKVNPTQCLKSE
ncbi:MAG: ABC transporter permease [Chryseolinea sp.]